MDRARECERSRGRWTSLLLEDQRRPAHSLRHQGDVNLDAVGDSDEGDAAVHPVVLAIEVQRPINLARAGALAGHGECELLGSGNSADRKVAVDLEGVGTGLYEFRRLERDQRIPFDVEEVFALQLAVLQAASGINRGSLNLDV